MQRGQGGGRQLALTSRLGSVSGESLRRTALVGLMCVLAAALLSACDDGPTATPTGPSAETTEPMPATSTPAPTPVPPTATPAPTPTPDPTATPTPPPAAPTPGPPTGAGAQRDFDIDSDTLWRELMDTLTASEQSCIRDELGDELLKSVLERRAPVRRRHAAVARVHIRMPRPGSGCRSISLCQPCADARTDRGG